MLEYILKEYEETDIFLSKLDYSFIIGFEDFLRSYVPKPGQSKIGNNTAMKHIKRLRRMVTLAYLHPSFYAQGYQNRPLAVFFLSIECQ